MFYSFYYISLFLVFNIYFKIYIYFNKIIIKINYNHLLIIL